MPSLFRYSGNKLKLLKYYKQPPQDCKKIVELYLGAGSYSVNSTLPATGYDTNEDLIAMWKWLQSTNGKELDDLKALVEDAKTKELKPDVKDLKLDLGPQTYVRVNVTSVMAGQLSSWKIYPQHNLPIEDTKLCLDRIKDIEVKNESCDSFVDDGNNILFIDPPYVGTTGNYLSSKNHEKSYKPQDTIDIISRCTSPIIFTYGTNADEIFPNFKWETVYHKKVPNLRRGGTVDRYEKVCYLNWR